MIHPPQHPLLHLVGYLIKAFAICTFSFTLLLLFVMLFDAQPLGDILITVIGPHLLRFGATTAILTVASFFLESLR